MGRRCRLLKAELPEDWYRQLHARACQILAVCLRSNAHQQLTARRLLQ